MSKSIVPLLLLLASVAHGASEADVRALEQQESTAWGGSTGDSSNAGDTKDLRDATVSVPNEPATERTLKLDPNIRPIEAEEFKVRVVKKSRSGKVFLIEDLSNNEPRPGKVILLKSGADDVAALRVLKNRDGRFIAKLVRRMGDLQEGTEYRALKKLGEKVVETPAKRQAQALDTTIRDDELAKEIDPNDVELDRGIPIPQKKRRTNITKTDEISLKSLEITEDDLADYSADFSQQEDSDLDPYNHALSMQLAFMVNGTADGSTKRYTAVGARYGYTFARRMLFNKPLNQDSFALEGGAFLYKIVGYETLSDELTVMPLLANLRYSVTFNEWFSIFAYAGAVKNFATVDAGAVSSIGNLQRTRPMGGLGFMLKLGPGWYVRGDAGIDMYAFGATLKF